MTPDKIKSTLDQTVDSIKPDDEIQVQKKFPQKTKKIKKSQPFIRKMLKMLHLFYQMIFDRRFYFSGKNRAIILGALLYFMIPMDLISDFIPVFGYIDDAMIVKFAWGSVQEEIEKYRNFLKGQNETVQLSSVSD